MLQLVRCKIVGNRSYFRIERSPALGLIDGDSAKSERVFRKRTISAKNGVVDKQALISMRSLVQKGGMPADQALRAIRAVLQFGSSELSQNADRISPDHFSLKGEAIPNLEPAPALYLAPELRLNGLESGERAAVYSIGVCLFELLTGEAPDERPFGPDVISAVRDAVVANGAAGFGVNDLAVTLSHLLNPDPFERYESLYDVDRALEQVDSFSAAKPEPSGGIDKPISPVSDMIRGFDSASSVLGENISAELRGSKSQGSGASPLELRERPADFKSGIKWATPDFDGTTKNKERQASIQQKARSSQRPRQDSSDRIELKMRTPQRSLLERVGWKGVRLQGDTNDSELEAHSDPQTSKSRRSRRAQDQHLDIETAVRKRPASRLSDRYATGAGLLSGSDHSGEDDAVPFVWDVLIVNFLLTLSIAFFIAALLLQCLEFLPVRQIMSSGLTHESLMISDRAALLIIIVAMLGLPTLILMAAASSAWRALLAWSQQVVVMLLLYALLFQVNLSRLASVAGMQELDSLAHMDAGRAALANLIEAALFSIRLTPFTASNRFAAPVFVEQSNMSIGLEFFGFCIVAILSLSTVLIVARQQRFGFVRAIRTFLPILSLIIFEGVICYAAIMLGLPILSERFALLPPGLGVEPYLCVLGFALANLMLGWIILARHARLRLKADNASWLSSLSRAKTAPDGFGS